MAKSNTWNNQVLEVILMLIGIFFYQDAFHLLQKAFNELLLGVEPSCQ